MNKEIKQIKPMICPVCGKFYFSELSEDDIKSGDRPNDVQCHMCGWKYDLEQYNNPDLENQSNKLSLNQYKKWYQDKIKINPKYSYLEENKPKPKPHKCPVCGKYDFEDENSNDICPICGWQDDGSETFNDDICGPNDLPFKDYKKRYEESLKKKNQ